MLHPPFEVGYEHASLPQVCAADCPKGSTFDEIAASTKAMSFRAFVGFARAFGIFKASHHPFLSLLLHMYVLVKLTHYQVSSLKELQKLFETAREKVRTTICQFVQSVPTARFHSYIGIASCEAFEWD